MSSPPPLSSPSSGSYFEVSIIFPSTPTHPSTTFHLSALPNETIESLYEQLETAEPFHTVAASRGTHLFNLFHVFSPSDLVPNGPSLERTKTLQACGVSHGTQLLALRQPNFTPEYISALEVLAARKEAELEEAQGAKSPPPAYSPATPPTTPPPTPALGAPVVPALRSPLSPPPPPAGRVVTKWPWSPTLSPYPPPIKPKVGGEVLEGVSPLLLRPVRGGFTTTTITAATTTATTTTSPAAPDGIDASSREEGGNWGNAAPPLPLPFPPPIRNPPLSYTLTQKPSSGENKHPSVAAFQRGLQVDLAAKKLKERPWLAPSKLDDMGYR